ncbi:glycosyltransferase family 39 protein [Humibacillus xanthopallidus]|nr:glycosyltransferase family 39 protein [Humibacillus xanthopallidus]
MTIASRDQMALPVGTWPYGQYFVSRGLPADPGYLGVITNWDGQWYQSIALDGYQVPLPDDPEAGQKLQAWAFPPGYPMLVRGAMAVTGLPFSVAATVISMVAGGLAMILLYRLLDRRAGAFIAASAVALLSTFPSAPLLQAAYSESLALLYLMLSLTLLASRRYLWCALAVSALAMSRLVTPPLALVVAAHFYRRFKSERRDLSTSDMVSLGFLFVLCVIGAVAWPVISSFFIGSQAGLARTSAPRYLRGWFLGSLSIGGPALLGAVLLLVLILMIFAMRHTTEGWGLELRVWSVAYPVYIFSVTSILLGVLRYFLLAPTFLLVAVMVVAENRWRAAVPILLCGLGLASQWWYVSQVLVVPPPAPGIGP